MSIYRVTLMETSADSNEETKYFPDTDSRCVANSFDTTVVNRTPLESGEQLNVSMGKISRYLKDIKEFAYSELYSSDTGYAENVAASSKALAKLREDFTNSKTQLDNLSKAMGYNAGGDDGGSSGFKVTGNAIPVSNADGTSVTYTPTANIIIGSAKNYASGGTIESELKKRGQGLIEENGYLYLSDGTQKLSSSQNINLSNIIKNSYSDVKTKLASAITAKGVNTASNATFDTMITNINNISAGKIETKTINAYGWFGGVNGFKGLNIESGSYTFPWDVKYAILFGEYYYIDYMVSEEYSIKGYMCTVSSVVLSSVQERDDNPYSGSTMRNKLVGDTQSLTISGKSVYVYSKFLKSDFQNSISESYGTHSDACLICVG